MGNFYLRNIKIGTNIVSLQELIWIKQNKTVDYLNLNKPIHLIKLNIISIIKRKYIGNLKKFFKINLVKKPDFLNE